ncbi:hypothetical protein [Halomonas sp. B23F22_10]|uniref:hypothetical protein n=1 Tax=Halomonas sp. B23F22_10 TaxID=3459515 RepID=UPI00373F1374
MKIGFLFERSAHKGSVSATEAKTNFGILFSIAWVGLKSLFWVVLVLVVLSFIESYISDNLSWIPELSDDDKGFNIDQLRLYSQLLTAIFSIYFATIGIILSAGYTRLRRDIIRMLTNEQVGSLYSRLLVLTTIFCLVATGLNSFGLEPGFLVYCFGTILTLLSALALFPLGQRLFNFFDLKVLVQSEIIPSLVRHIEGAASHRNSIFLANHHSRAARQALEQLSYIDDRIKAEKESLQDNLPALSDAYTALLLHYLRQKHAIDQESYWFPRRNKHKQWFLAGDSTTSRALKTSSQEMLMEEKPDHRWLENEIVNRLASHIELALEVGDFDLSLQLIGRFSTRLSDYAVWFHFDVGMQEVKRFKSVIEQAFRSSVNVADAETAKLKIGLADTWAALGNNLCLETLRRMITFEKELKQFFEADEWSKKSLRRLPAFLQAELDFIVERIEFEKDVEGQRLSKPKYVQQLAVQKLLLHYSNVLPAVCDFYQNMIPDFVDLMASLEMSEAATQVVLASLHSHWKLPAWFDELEHLVDRYQSYRHYSEEQYALCEINFAEMTDQFSFARDGAISRLSNGSMVGHIFEPKHNDEVPDHFGQIYFELAESCISAIEHNEESKLGKVVPMFLGLAFLAADSKFVDPDFDVNDEFRLHLISTVINDLASVLGFAILYGAYFENDKLSESALAQFDSWVKRSSDKQKYLKRMLLLSNPFRFSMRASPRSLIRTNWKMSFENRVRNDGYGDQMSMGRGSQHPNEIVREFLMSLSDASHLFFALHVIPEIEIMDFEVDDQITALADRFSKDGEE